MIVSPIVLGKLLHWMYLVKLDSAQGRLLIWKNTVALIKDNFWTGVGYGNFPKAYTAYQVTLSLIIYFTNLFKFRVGFQKMGKHFPESYFSVF